MWPVKFSGFLGYSPVVDPITYDKNSSVSDPRYAARVRWATRIAYSGSFVSIIPLLAQEPRTIYIAVCAYDM